MFSILALAQIVVYQRIIISNMILHINHAVCKWPKRKNKEEDGRKHKNVALKRQIFPFCNNLKMKRLDVALLIIFYRSCESFLPSGHTIIIKTSAIVPLIKPHREGAGLINTSYSRDYCLFRPDIDSKTSRLHGHVKLQLICS